MNTNPTKQKDNSNSVGSLYTPEQLEHLAHSLFAEEKARDRLDGWFIAKEIQAESDRENADRPALVRAALALREIARHLPLELSDNAVFAGTQRDAFARSYALINPTFEVETFSGYCDPTAVYNDIEPNQEFSRERIEAMRAKMKQHPFVESLDRTYSAVEDYTGEVSFFIEQVTGHVIPDLRPLLTDGTQAAKKQLQQSLAVERNEKKRANFEAMLISLESVEILAERYRKITLAKAASPDLQPLRQTQLLKIADALENVPKQGARDLFEAIQSFLLIWQVMCLEQAPNPFAFSVGNADRIFEPYRAKTDMSREQAAGLLKHFLVFFNVGDRSWAISQNILISGRDTEGNDLTNLSSYALLDAYYAMNLPQPILSVKLHRNTPRELYRELGRFFFTPGTLTPSLFNDDSLFEVLSRTGIDQEDLPDYAIAGCQEPLIMGRDNGNTTNSWLNLAKILELAIHNGRSALTGTVMGPEDEFTKLTSDKLESQAELTNQTNRANQTSQEEALARLSNIRQIFEQRLRFYVEKMADSANGATRALSLLPVPFLSTMMGGIESGYDMRDTEDQGTKYNGAGCLIHGLAVVADSLVAIDHFLITRPQDAAHLIDALGRDFKGPGDEALRQFLASCPKFGNNDPEPDQEAARLTEMVSDIVAAQTNDLGNPFRPDYATPSTHLLYGYWVGATPDGRHAREMLNYGTDPLAGDASNGLGFRMLSGFCLPYEKMCGGYASHFGIDPKYFQEKELEARGEAFADRVIAPLFFNQAMTDRPSPFYLYVNITTAETLRKVLSNPAKYAPSGVYIMRIHGTFVNFLDLSPAIQQDIIARLDPEASSLS